jgi:hypothetical protein
MSKSNSPEPKRFDFEAERKKIAATQTPEAGEGVHWDKPSPTESPVHAAKAIPKHLTKVVGFFQSIVLDESLVLELCLERCIEMVQQQVERKLVGTDHFQESTPGAYAAIASPMTVELYKQVLSSIGERSDEYQKLLKEATAERERAATPEPARIVIP